MAKTDKHIFEDSNDINVNKRFRYMCLRKLIKWRVGVKCLVEDPIPIFEKEQKRNFSDLDAIEKLMFDASKPDTASKEAIFKSFLVQNKWKQQEFMALTSCFYNKADTA